MEFSLLEREHWPDEALLESLSAVIKESWRKILVNLGAYTPEYEQNEAIWGVRTITTELEKGNRWLLGWENGTLVAGLIVDEIEQEGRAGYQLRRFVVHPAAQGRGHGAALVDQVVAMAAREGKSFMALFTSGRLVTLVNYYQRLGFVEYRRENVVSYGVPYERIFLRRFLSERPAAVETA